MQTQYQIAKGICLYKATIAKLALAASLREELKKQILTTIDRMYLMILEDATFGFSKLSVLDMLTHLSTTYSTITWSDLESNRASIATIWSTADPIKILWDCLREVQHIAAAGGDPLSDATIIDLTTILFESTGIFTLACDMWRLCPAANKTYIKFCEFFTTENKEHLRKNITTVNGGYHSANTVAHLPIKPTQNPFLLYLPCPLHPCMRFLPMTASPCFIVGPMDSDSTKPTPVPRVQTPRTVIALRPPSKTFKAATIPSCQTAVTPNRRQPRPNEDEGNQQQQQHPLN